MRRLVAAGLLPERAGQPVRVWAHVSLAELRALDDGSVLQGEWIGEMAVRWAARRAAASQAGGDGAAWLDGKPARAMACDATILPVVTGEVDPGALDDLVALCLHHAGHGPHCGPGPEGHPPGPAGDQPGAAGQPGSLPGPAGPADQSLDPQPADPSGPTSDRSGAAGPADGPDPGASPGRPGGPGQPGNSPGGDDPCPSGLRPPTPDALEMLRHAIIRTAVDLVSGPGGLASFLRTRLLGARLAGPSLPLDVGRSAEIPAAIRRAVILRDQHCRWAGGCDQPASACEVHHVTHLADGGTTSVDRCALYCFFHHHVAIHQWGWTVALHPDGTTTARSPDGTKILHSHSPPARAG